MNPIEQALQRRGIQGQAPQPQQQAAPQPQPQGGQSMMGTAPQNPLAMLDQGKNDNVSMIIKGLLKYLDKVSPEQPAPPTDSGAGPVMP